MIYASRQGVILASPTFGRFYRWQGVFFMAHESSDIDFWALKPVQLAHECRLIAEGTLEGADETLRLEARELATEWRLAIDMPRDQFDEQARRAARIAGLRKRTIEILVKVTGSI
jgi:hypothetical protein